MSPAPLVPVGGLFAERAAADGAVLAFSERGVPRDLVEVAVSREAARRFYGGRARAWSRQPMRLAGAFALVGLVAGAVFSLGMLAYPGQQDARLLVLVQLLGPNVATVMGAALGALIGLVLRRRPEARHARAAARADAILVVVRVPPAEAAGTAQLLERLGAREVEADAAGAAPR